MTKKRVEIYSRLPEIYRIKDEALPETYLHGDESVPAKQLKAFLEPVEEMFGAVHENIESLYHDFFIETCDEWVIPYIADLLGTTHISGDAWTRRADVADTIALRRRKGTLGAIELLVFILTQWGVHSVEMMETMVMNQHLNHQRPDEGGAPPYGLATVGRKTPIRGGTVTMRDPSVLNQLNTPFDPFAHFADVRPHETGQVRHNLPNLAIYLWRLGAYRLNATKPLMTKVTPASGANRVVRINIDSVPVNDISGLYVLAGNEPAGRPLVLFNTSRNSLNRDQRTGLDELNLSSIAPRISSADEVAGPIPRARISDYDFAEDYDASLASTSPQPFETFAAASFSAPHEYVSVNSYDPGQPNLNSLEISDVGLQFHLPDSEFFGDVWPHTGGRDWTIRGENLCAWEAGLHENRALQDREIAIDPERGRICIGVTNDAKADALLDELLVTYTYGAVGEVGAHPGSYPDLPDGFNHNLSPNVIFREVNTHEGPTFLVALKSALQEARLAVAADPNQRGKLPIVIEISDSRTHPFNIANLDPADRITEDGLMSIKLNGPLIIRAADGVRPVIELSRPLAFRPADVFDPDPDKQKSLDAFMSALFVRLEGLYLARNFSFSLGQTLVARAAVNRLEVLNCSLDPGGFEKFDGSRAPLLPGIRLTEPYGFDDADEEAAFVQTPEVNIQRSVVGAIISNVGYRFCIADSIVESIPVDAPLADATPNTEHFSVLGDPDALSDFAGQLQVDNVTFLGRVRCTRIEGSGTIFSDVLQVEDQQYGCLKYCYFSDDSLPVPPDEIKNLLPQNFACVNGADARLIFTSEIFGQPAYCQLSLECDPRILEEGQGSDQMGAYNFLQEAHKWRNLKIRFREFMPIGIRPLLIPVT